MKSSRSANHPIFVQPSLEQKPSQPKILSNYNSLYQKRKGTLSDFESFLKTRLDSPDKKLIRTRGTVSRTSLEKYNPKAPPGSFHPNIEPSQTLKNPQKRKSNKEFSPEAAERTTAETQSTPHVFDTFFVRTRHGIKVPQRSKDFKAEKSSSLEPISNRRYQSVELDRPNLTTVKKRPIKIIKRKATELTTRGSSTYRESPVQNLSKEDQLRDFKVASSTQMELERSMALSLLNRDLCPSDMESRRSIFQDKVLEEQRKSRREMISFRLLKLERAEEETKEQNGKESPILTELVSRLKVYESRSKNEKSPAKKKQEEEENPASFKKLPQMTSLGQLSMNRTKESFVKTLLDVGSRECVDLSLPRKISSPYIPTWLTGRQDYVKALQNMQSDRHNLIINICQKPPSERSAEDVERVSRWLSKVKNFRNISKQLLDNISRRLRYRFYQKDEVLCEKDDPGDCLYIIYDGQIQCLLEDVEVAIFKTYDAPGQSALDSAAPRAARLIASTPTSILRLEREDYKQVMEIDINQKKKRVLALLERVLVLNALSDQKKQVISSCLQWKYYTQGEVIYREGEMPESFFIVESGRFEIEAFVDLEHENLWPIAPNLWERKAIERNAKFTSTINPNQYFGETELISGTKRLNTVTCVENSQVLFMNKFDFLSLFNGEDIQRFKESSKRDILQDPDLMRRRILEREAEKKKLKDIVVISLKNHISGLGPTKQNVQNALEFSIKKFSSEYNQYIHSHTVGKPSKMSEVIPYNIKNA